MDKELNNPIEKTIIPIKFVGCHICENRTTVKSGFRYGITLYKDPLNSNKYLCEKHAGKHQLPWRLKKPNEFRALLSQLGNPNRSNKKIMNKMRKVRA